MLPWQNIYALNRNMHLVLTHWGRVTHICVGNQTIIGSDNGLSPDRCQAFIWNNAGILLIGPLVTNFSEILIEIYTLSFKRMHMKMSSGKWRLLCLGLNVLRFRYSKRHEIRRYAVRYLEGRHYVQKLHSTMDSQRMWRANTTIFVNLTHHAPCPFWVYMHSSREPHSWIWSVSPHTQCCILQHVMNWQTPARKGIRHVSIYFLFGFSDNSRLL